MSAALVADGYHARTDGWTSLAVLAWGSSGCGQVNPLADPIVGLLITLAILGIVRQSGKLVLTRLLDGVDPEVTDEIRHAAGHVPGAKSVTEVRARWSGPELHAEVEPNLSVAEGHAVAPEAHRLLHGLGYLRRAVIHVDPYGEAGEEYYRIPAHSHDDLPVRSHH